jgi:TolB-like protein/DNA-binding winged helix-turn-helix (wHTH) protein/tetratricopeptide (TPR) repeat protein
MSGTFQFSDYVLDSGRYELRRGERTLKLEKIPMELLILLVEREGALVSREEILQRIWGKDVFFESDSGINTAVSKLRQALRDDAERPKYIQTVVGKGYRFVAPIDHPPAPSMLEEERNGSEKAPTVSDPTPVQAVQSRMRRRWAILAVAVVLIALAVGSYVYRSGNSQSSQTIAVLPFKPLSAGASDGFLELGMADTLITRLSRTRGLIVRPTSAIRKYTGADSSPLAAGQALQVDAVLDGTIQRVGDRLRVSVRLLRVRDGASLWSNSYDTNFTDVFQVQDAVSERVVDALAVRLSSLEEASLRKRDTSNVQAYELYMKGIFFWNKRSEDGLRKAVDYFQQAIAADENYALAYAGLAAALNPLGYRGYAPSDEVRPKIRAAATRAVSLDPDLPEAHVVLGAVLSFYEWNGPEGEKEFRRALELNPKLPLAHHWYAMSLQCRGRYQEAVQHRQRAQELDPITPVITTGLGDALFLTGDDEGALTQYHKALELDNSLDETHVGIGHVYERRGDYKSAITEYRLAVQYSPRSRASRAALGHALAQAGETSEAKQILNELVRLSHEEYVSPVHVAIVSAGFGDRETALNWLAKAHDERNSSLSGIGMELQLKSLSGDPRFQKLLRQIGLQQPVK